MGRTTGWAWISTVAALALATACGGGDSGDDDDDIVLPDADTSGNPDAPPGGGDGNDSFGDAQELTVDGPGGQGVIQEPLDHDFFKFTGTAGAWLHIVTVANPNDDPALVDTVVQLYDESMTRIAENDDAVPRVNTDSELALRLPATGTYYLEIQEFSDWDPASPTAEGDPSYTYQILITTFDGMAPGILEETTDAGDMPGTAVAAKFNMNSGVILGDLNGPGDVDVYSLAVGAAGPGVPLLISSAVAPAGDTGYGSTTSVGELYITNMANTQVLAKIVGTDGRFALSPPVQANTTYLLWVKHPGGTAGANDFYFYRFFIGQENPAETETVPGTNDTTTGAESKVFEMGSFFVLAHLPDGDVDYFRFQATAGQMLSVACTAHSSGSGVTGFRAEVRGPTDVPLSGVTEPSAQTLSIGPLTVATSDTHYLRLSKTGQEAGINGDWARCGVHVN
jgi:hypothetical protein